MMIQHNMRKSLEDFGEQGSATMDKEVIQILTMDVIEPYYPKDLTKEDRYT